MATATITSDNKCQHCKPSTCCTYVTQAIDTPTSKQDFDYLLWQVSHENVQCFKDESGWYLRIVARCSHLRDDGRCGIYANRPQICRDHSNDWCDFDVDATKEEYELFFPDHAGLDSYCHQRFKNWGQRFE